MNSHTWPAAQTHDLKRGNSRATTSVGSRDIAALRKEMIVASVVRTEAYRSVLNRSGQPRERAGQTEL